jgi:hypothetical protein
MNKYQKILTILALLVFSAIIALEYHWQHGWDVGNPDVYMPLFVLSVLYAGCMALAWTRRQQ